MATTKAAGTAKNLNDSNPKYLGVKRGDGSSVGIGEIIVRQRGTKIMAGRNIGVGKDHTLFSLIKGFVKFSTKRKGDFDGRTTVRSSVEIVPAK
jgi:large subunit ribosomal protein L27